ncbi:MAG: M23 family metallopeptidase, partial [Nitriliruptor sp.]
LLGLAAAAIALVVSALGTDAASPAADTGQATTATPTPAPSTGTRPRVAPDPRGGPATTPGEDEEVPVTPPMARVGTLLLSLPAASPVVVGYHEAAHVSATDLLPIGTVRDDRNTTRTSLPADDPDGAPYLVLTSRGRAAGPTSAVDVVLPEGEPVLAPVTGTVADVREYRLYGAHEDLRIEIVPDARPDLRLVLIHLDGARVRVGDRVTGGLTPIASTARLLPFSSHIDRETEPERFPHVHLELQPIDRPRPGVEDDPDAPAEDEGATPRSEDPSMADSRDG